PRSNEELLIIYLGLLEQQARFERIAFDRAGSADSLWTIIDNAFPTLSNDLPAYRSYFQSVCSKIKTIELKIDGLKKADSDSLQFENYYSLVSNSLDLLK